MAARVAEAQEDQRPGAGAGAGSGSGAVRGRGAWMRALLFVTTALVAGATGVAGTLLHQRPTGPDTSAVDAQAAGLARDLRNDLTSGFYSPGRTFGGQFTEGTIVAQTEARGGVLLSAGTAQGGSSGGKVHTAQVMLGLVAPGKGTVDADAYPVRCYRYTFGFGAYSVEQSAMTCPDTRTDGKPGSLAAQLGVLLARQANGTAAYRELATEGYAHTPQGATDFLKEKRLVATGDTVSQVAGEAEGADIYILALRVNGVCHYLRMDSSSNASSLIPLWVAPADEQETCAVKQAVAATTLYGIDPAKAG